MNTIGQDQPKELARFESFYDNITMLDDLGDSIQSLVEWIETGNFSGQDPKSEATDRIKSVNALLKNLESDLHKKYHKFEELLDNLLVSLCINTDINLVRASKSTKDASGETSDENNLNVEDIIVAMHAFWNVYNTLENIYRYLTWDASELESLAKAEVNLDECNKSVDGIFINSDMIQEIVKVSGEKLENIRNVFA